MRKPQPGVPSSASAGMVARRFAPLVKLSPADLALLDGTASRLVHYPSRTELLREGEDLRPLLLVEGWACRQRVFPDGRRQVMSFYLPGDLIGSVLDRRAQRSPSSLFTLTPVIAADASALRKALVDDQETHAGLAQACRLSETFDEMCLLNHVVRLGRQTAYERMAHLLLEICDRLDQVGLVSNRSFTMPMTQEILADALGLSIVHVNRTLQQLRRDGLIELKGPAVVLKDDAALADIADYRPLRTLI